MIQLCQTPAELPELCLRPSAPFSHAVQVLISSVMLWRVTVTRAP